jgi:hypothetical protein
MKTPDVVVYLSSLQKQNPSRKIDTLIAFADGARSQGATVHIETQDIYTPSKLAVILGWASPEQHTPNIKLRAHIIQQQKQLGNHVMAIDANCFKFADPASQYLRYSINGVFYDTSEYVNKNSDSSRWDQLSQNINVNLADWRIKGNYILLLMQRDGGWSMKGVNPLAWAHEKIRAIREHSDMHIVLRPHPGKITDVSALTNSNVSISNTTARSLLKDLKHAVGAFVFNSSSGVAAILHGVPLWVDDPGSVCWDVANQQVGRIYNPELPDRTQWLNDLSACHWTDEESRQGLIYKKFLPYLV